MLARERRRSFEEDTGLIGNKACGEEIGVARPRHVVQRVEKLGQLGRQVGAPERFSTF